MKETKISKEELAHKAQGLPPAQGMYDPAYEKDACGVGFIANMDGTKTHDMIQDALNILVKLTHRGACSCDNKTGDGAGILIQIPHEFYNEETDFELPEPGRYGTGIVFLPKEPVAKAWIMKTFEEVSAANGEPFLGWRELPVDQTVLGEIAAASEPSMMQIFIASEKANSTQREFERELFIIVKRLRKRFVNPPS